MTEPHNGNTYKGYKPNPSFTIQDLKDLLRQGGYFPRFIMERLRSMSENDFDTINGTSLPQWCIGRLTWARYGINVNWAPNVR